MTPSPDVMERDIERLYRLLKDIVRNGRIGLNTRQERKSLEAIIQHAQAYANAIKKDYEIEDRL